MEQKSVKNTCTNKSSQKKKECKKEAEKNPFDVLGSYTGVPADGGKPIQDADDL